MAGSVLVAIGQSGHIVDQVVKAASQISLGRDMGALIDGGAVERLRRAIDSAEKEGAKVVLDGRKVRGPVGYESGSWLGPTILDGVKSSMECACAELFGPILSVIRVETLEDAMGLERKSPYGNATSVFTTSGAVAHHVAQHSTSGMIGINIGVPVPREPFSFGGTKESRFGAGDITGFAGVEFWSYKKKVTSKWALQSDKNWMS